MYNISATANARDFRFRTRVGHVNSYSCDEWVLPKWAWSGSREQFLHCGLRKFRHSKSSVYRCYTQLDRRRFVYDTWDNGSRLGRVIVKCTLSITHCLRLNLQLHTIDLVWTCRISSFCTAAWQLARFQLTRRIAHYLGDSWASCVQYGACLHLSLQNVWGAHFLSGHTVFLLHYRVSVVTWVVGRKMAT